MNKIVKRALSLLVCLAMLLCTAPFAGAKAKACACREIPRIGVPGIGDALYLNYGTPEQTKADVVSMDGLKEQILPMVKNIIAAVARQSWNKGADAINALAQGMFDHLRVDERGKSVQPLSTGNKFDPAQDHRENHSYTFHYDWRLDPMKAAVELNKYIKRVIAGTGHRKVILWSDSEGALVSMAYFAQFGYGDIEHFISQVPAFNGLTLIGELFIGNIKLGMGQTMDFLRTYGQTDENGFMSLMGPIADLLETTKLALPLINALDQILFHTKDRLYAETLVPIFGQFPALWGFVPDEYYEPAKKFMFGNDPKYKDFIKLIDNFHYKAGPGKADGLVKKAAKATKVSLVAGYGFAPMPFTPQIAYDTDGLIDTARESCGATTAGFGKTFPAGYKQKYKDGHNHVSPDMRIDASTCVLPDQTWFLKNKLHFAGGSGGLVDFLAYSKKQPTVFDDPKFPQFMTRLSNDTFVATLPEEPAEPATLGSSLRGLTAGSWRLVKAGITGK